MKRPPITFVNASLLAESRGFRLTPHVRSGRTTFELWSLDGDRFFGAFPDGDSVNYFIRGFDEAKQIAEKRIAELFKP